MPKLSTNHLLIFLLTLSSAALTFAYITQYGFGFEPCILCLHERKPFFAIIALTALALTIFKSPLYKKIAFFSSLLLLLTNATIATYHVGVEQKIFKGPSTCSSSNLNDFDNLEDLKAAMAKTKAIRCDEPSFFFLNLSMAAWNLIFCLFLFCVFSFSYRKLISHQN